MNKVSFIDFVEKDRECDEVRLDSAVERGLRRAKSGIPDSRKFLALAAACAFTVAMCFSVNLRPFKSAAETYRRNRIETMPGSGAALEGYVSDIAKLFDKLKVTNNSIERYLGGI